MSRITDYSFLFQNLAGATKKNKVNPIQLSNLNSSSVRAQLKAAGIDTNSKQYKAAISEMMKAAKGNGAMFTNIQAIKNMMSQYDKAGDWIDPDTGLTGLLVTDENRAGSRRIVAVPEKSREEMFNLLKKEFVRENGVLNGDTTKKSDVYDHLYPKIKKDDRLAAGWTLSQYERQYRQAFISAVKQADPNWEIGKPVPGGALDRVKREDIENSLIKAQGQYGGTFISRTVDISV